jgi:hypothetical protein
MANLFDSRRRRSNRSATALSGSLCDNANEHDDEQNPTNNLVAWAPLHVLL